MNTPIYDVNGIVLYNADVMEIMAGMADESVDLICTDPPYRVTTKGTSGSMGGYWKSKKAGNGRIFNDNDIQFSDYMPEFFRILKDGTHCYVMVNHINLIECLNAAMNAGFKFIKSLIWDKGNKICGRFYMNCFEYILMFRRGATRDINDFSTPDILSIPIKKLKNPDGSNMHDTEKPVDLMKILVRNSSNAGDLVFEPFAGIGSTLIASKELNRKCIGCEINDTYAEIIVKRLDDKIKNILEQNEPGQIELF